LLSLLAFVLLIFLVSAVSPSEKAAKAAKPTAVPAAASPRKQAQFETTMGNFTVELVCHFHFCFVSRSSVFQSQVRCSFLSSVHGSYAHHGLQFRRFGLERFLQWSVLEISLLQAAKKPKALLPLAFLIQDFISIV
jgi:hypothetical protein